MNEPSPSNEYISKRSYQLLERVGWSVGRDQEFWLRAEAELATPAKPAGAPPAMVRPVASPASNPKSLALHACRLPSRTP